MHHWHGTHGTYGYRVQKNVAIWENHRSLNGSSHGFQQTKESIPMKDPSFIPGWWYTYPSEKMKSVSWGYYHSQLNGKIKNVPNHQPDPHSIHMLIEK